MNAILQLNKISFLKYIDCNIKPGSLGEVSSLCYKVKSKPFLKCLAILNSPNPETTIIWFDEREEVLLTTKFESIYNILSEEEKEEAGYYLDLFINNKQDLAP